MIHFGKEIDLSLTGKHLPRRYHKDLKKQNERACGLWNRLYKQNQPGVLLADEVGKGKTYVALAVALSVLASKQQGRVLVLTHSSTMARIWQRRWLEMIGNCILESGKKKLEKIDLKAYSYRSVDELANSGANRPVIPEQVGHPFRRNPATDSGASRPLLSGYRKS